ncbi:hypothetical protein F5890DRAFT_1421815, partial [Lentinula detonsa]
TLGGEHAHCGCWLCSPLYLNIYHQMQSNDCCMISGQLHRSCVKWGFLKPYMSQTTFAISLFHAFGHQWPCQIIYHPQKCIGYGLSDGEGAEQLWHMLSWLIAYRRVGRCR